MLNKTDLIYVLKNILITDEIFEDSRKPELGKETQGSKV